MSLGVWGGSAPAAWLEQAVPDGLVGEAVPNIFEAYVRVLHPAGFEDREGLRSFTWETVAASNRHRLAGDSRWDSIAKPERGTASAVEPLWNREPVEGSLSRETAGVLGQVLSSHTATRDVMWMCAWEGWAGLRWVTSGPEVDRLDSRDRRKRYWWGDSSGTRQKPLATVRLLGREYVLLRGLIADVGQSVVDPPAWQSANLWWPDDRSWFVSTPIDGRSTFVGGSQACIGELLTADGVEALAIPATR